MNADFVPGIVSVLYGDELQARGIRSVSEAMTLAPGIHLSLTSDKIGKTVVRGIPKIFASGHIKVLLDGTPLTTAFGIDPVPNMPIEQVERIEIMRGPGSAIHGEFAYTGVMNIITRKKGSRVFGAVESGNTYKGGAIASGKLPESDLTLSINVSGIRSDGAGISGGAGTFSLAESGILSGNDNNYEVLAPPLVSDSSETADSSEGPPFAIAEMPDRVTEKGLSSEDSDVSGGKRDYLSGLFGLNYRNFSFQGYVFENNQEDFHKTRLWGMNAAQRFEISPSLQADLKLGWQQRKFEQDLQDADTSEIPDIYQFDYDECLFQGGFSLLWKGWDRHRMLLEWAFARSVLDDLRRETSESSEEILEGKNRLVSSLTVQDEFEANDQLTFTAGLRYDYYDDIGEKFSPRIAAVYRLNKQRNAAHRHILKAQYARAFRPPTFLEMYGTGESGLQSSFFSSQSSVSPDTESETVDTYEIGYIYRTLNTVGRVTLFYSELDARLDAVRESPRHFHSKGAELELEQHLIPDMLKLDANLSYTKSKDRETGAAIPETADWLANVGLIFQPFRNVSFALQYRYAGSRNFDETSAENTGDAPDDCHTADFTVNLWRFGVKGLTLRGGVKNLFEEDIRYPSSSYYQNQAFVNNLSDSEDNLDSERWWWIQVSYEF
ncbi:MAG: hypothetical protein BWK80_20905 [Desulfobacteraceae bacterium IS3]|nr:MAG: hypothetical protein BWK80_20905 [Desulfobacteraceae bacterium IS3]